MNVYELYKKDNIDSIILIKSGNFYLTYNVDALILNKLFNYQVNNNKVGFPLKSLDKVIYKLDSESINYLVYDKELINNKTFEDNKYNTILNDIKKIEYQNNMKKLLYDRIEYLISVDNKNFDKIRNFIDEL